MKKNKYNKKLKYRKHPDLIDNINSKRFFTIMGMMSIFILIITILNIGSYSNFSKSIDFTSIVVLSAYTFIIRPNIYNGKIRAYYRRSYKNVSTLNNMFLILISTFSSRFIIVSLFQVVALKNITYPIENIIHPLGNFLILVPFLLMLYFTFFNDKYTTVKEFSNKVNYEMMFNDKNLRSSIMHFYNEKDKEYDIKEFDGTYYDYEKEMENFEKLKKEKEEKERNNIRREMRDKDDRNNMDKQIKKRL